MRSLILAFICLSAGQLFAQVPKVRIVEHFTNSSCSSCAGNNPTIYGVLQSNPAVLHLSIYPSSPYPNCFFSLQNPVENDARTNYYGLYGSTPKLVLNGGLVSVSSLSAGLQTTASDMTNFEVRTVQTFYGTDSVLVAVVIKKVAADTMLSATLFAAAFQDTVFQTTNNGETVHHDVFRKALTAPAGNVIALPSMVNDSIIIPYAYAISANWQANRMKTMVILQNSITKNTIQAAVSYNNTTIPTNQQQVFISELLIVPNPVYNTINLIHNNTYNQYVLRDLTGRVLKRNLLATSKIDVSDIPQGMYLLQLSNSKESKTYSFTKHE